MQVLLISSRSAGGSQGRHTSCSVPALSPESLWNQTLNWVCKLALMAHSVNSDTPEGEDGKFKAFLATEKVQGQLSETLSKKNKCILKGESWV